MKILHVCETAIGGIATYLSTFSAIAPAGSRSAFVIPNMHREHLGPDELVYGFPGQRRGLGLSLGMLAEARRAITDFQPDIVFFHSTFSLLALGAMRLLGWRGVAVYVPHSWSIAMFENKSGPTARMVRLVEGNLAGLADRVIDVGDADFVLAQQFGYRGRQVVVENPARPARVDARNDLFADEPDKLHLLFVGRFDRQKGFDLLLEAFVRAQAYRSDLHLHLVGGRVRATEKIKLPPGVSRVGWVTPQEIDDWYRSADAVIIPSRWEGLPIVVPEALRNGTPVLCSRRSCLDMLIEAGVTGECFELTVEAITELLVGLDREKLAAWRPAALAAYEERFSIPMWKARMDALLAELAAEARR